MEPIKFTEDQKRIYRLACCPSNATDEHVAFFFLECERRALIPNVHVVLQIRTASEFKKELQRSVDVQKPILVTTINALRLIAERSGKFRGYGNQVFHYAFGSDTFTESKIPLGRIPHAVTTELYRDGWLHPVLGIARFEACVQLKGDKTPTAMWFKRGEEQLAKCSEADGLRKIAPEECSGLYIEEEMGKEERDTEISQNEKAEIPKPTVAPIVNQEPAKVEITNVPATLKVAVNNGTVITHPVVQQTPSSAPKPAVIARPAVPKPLVAPKPPSAPVAVPETPVATGTGNIHGLAITDNDLPDFTPSALQQSILVNGAAAAEALLAPVYLPLVPNCVPAAPSEDEHKPWGGSTTAEGTVAKVDAPAQEPPANPDDLPATKEQYNTFVAIRCKKIVHDILEKNGLKGAGEAMHKYLLRASGKEKLGKISAKVFEELISVLEKSTPEAAIKIVKGVQ